MILAKEIQFAPKLWVGHLYLSTPKHGIDYSKIFFSDGKKRYVGVKNFQSWNDEQIAVYDCQGKLSGYKYMGLYDVDEYIHAPLDNDILSLMVRSVL